jgi:predicted nucleic-acid-binding protein
MIGVDTNVLVRYIAQDDPIQSSRATAFIDNDCSVGTPGFVSLVVLAEVVWVGESCYGATRKEIAEILRRMLSVKQLVVQDAETAWKALRAFESSTADFADCLIERTASAAGCERTMTFDKRASKAGMVLLT